MKQDSGYDIDWERKPKKVVKDNKKASKYKKSIYNMLSEYEDDDNDAIELELSYETSSSTKQR